MGGTIITFDLDISEWKLDSGPIAFELTSRTSVTFVTFMFENYLAPFLPPYMTFIPTLASPVSLVYVTGWPSPVGFAMDDAGCCFA